MRVGASRTAPDLTITAPHRSALAPAAQPRPATPRRALPSARVSKMGAILDADRGAKFDADRQLRVEAAIFASVRPVPREALVRVVGADCRFDDLIADLIHE